jgi:thiamine pyridinylase
MRPANILLRNILCFAVTFSLACAQDPKVELRVALFPYIPDALGDKHAALQARIKKEFEERYNATLVLRPFNPADEAFYDLKSLTGWLDKDSHQYDLVEIDAVLLGELAATKLIAPWGKGIREADWHPAARRAVTLFGDIFGAPHLLCSYFTFSTDSRIGRANTIAELIKATRKSSVGNGRFAADILGSWDTPALYLDAWADAHPRFIESGIADPLDEQVIDGMAGLVRLCAENGKNPCFEDTYNDNTEAAIQAGQGKIALTVGYSERLHTILKSVNKFSKVYVNSAPLGNGSNPLVFTDALVKRAGCTDECAKAAVAFALYLMDPRTQEWILMSRDGKDPSIPRYLLPATMSAYEQQSLRSDPFYPFLRELIKHAQPYPSFGLYAVRSMLRDAVLRRLKEASSGQK